MSKRSLTHREKIAVVAGAALLAVVFVAVFAVRHGFFDLNVYYGAINYWADGGHLYDYVRPRSTYGFTYPPFAALTMLPMAVVSWPVAVVIGCALTVVATVWLLRELLRPMIAKFRWTPWFALALALCLVAMFEPMRETILFGQVNMLLLGLVAFDLLVLLKGRSRWAGVGIGLATAIKLTPGIFIVYLLLTKRWRAAATAAGTAAAATLVAGAVAPKTSLEFWTSALWDTDRVGWLPFISNQSLLGMLGRLNPAHPSKAVWAVLVVGVLAFWAWRVRKAAAQDDVVLGLALTGIVGLLISPVTWVHHLVWTIPAFVLVAERGTRNVRIFGVFAFVIMSSRLIWPYEEDFGGLGGFLFSNAYLWMALALLVLTPSAPSALPPQRKPDHRKVGVKPLQPKKRPVAVR